MDNNDLTTDAMPSPARDSATENVSEKPQVESSSEEDLPKSPPTYKVPPKSKTFKSKPKPPAFNANVINIIKSHDVHIGSKVTVVIPDKKSATTPKTYEETEQIRTLFNDKSAITRDLLMFVSKHVNESWRDVARSLDYSEGQIDQFYENHSHVSIKEVIYQFLLDWMRSNPDDATVENLSKILWKNNQKDVVHRWSLKK